jgi:hypothetical protein
MTMKGCRNYVCTEVELFLWFGNYTDKKELIILQSNLNNFMLKKEK